MAVGNFIYVGKSRLRRKFKRKKYSLDNTPKRKPPKQPQPQQLEVGGIGNGYQPLTHGDDVLHIELEDSCLQDHGEVHSCRYCISESASLSSGYSSDSEDLLPRVELDFIELRPRVPFHTMLPFAYGKTQVCEIPKMGDTVCNNGDVKEGKEDGTGERDGEEVMEEIMLADEDNNSRSGTPESQESTEKQMDMETLDDGDSVLGNDDDIETTGNECLLDTGEVTLASDPVATPRKTPGHFFNREVFQEKDPKSSLKSLFCCLLLGHR